MKQCRDACIEKCLIQYGDYKDFEYCPYCGSKIVWSMPYKQFLKNERGVFGADVDVLKIINALEKDHHIINIKMTEIIEWDELKPVSEEYGSVWHSSTLRFEASEETNIDKLFKALHKYKPDEFDRVMFMSEFRPEFEVYRMWWD